MFLLIDKPGRMKGDTLRIHMLVAAILFKITEGRGLNF